MLRAMPRLMQRMAQCIVCCVLLRDQLATGISAPGTGTGTDTDTGNASGSIVQPADGLFYMYELEQKFWWRYPASTVNCNKSKGYLPTGAYRNAGLGDTLDLDMGLFSTWHFSMFNSLFNRLRRSARRTRDPEQASFFVFPYDMALDGFIRQVDCSEPYLYPRCTKPLVMEAKEIFRKSKYFQRYQGADHLLLWSLGEMHPRPADCQTFMQSVCEKCSLTCYWMDRKQKEKQYISLPMPSSFHYHDALKYIPYKAGLPSDRPVFAVYAGSTLTLNPDHTKIRRAAVAQCAAYSGCSHLSLEHSSSNAGMQAALSAYRQSVFCLCPPGDDPSRKALLDILLMGCIPVVMHHSTLHNQYPYIINETSATEISIFIPGSLCAYCSLCCVVYMYHICIV
jgi:hypothetical protein